MLLDYSGVIDSGVIDSGVIDSGVTTGTPPLPPSMRTIASAPITVTLRGPAGKFVKVAWGDGTSETHELVPTGYDYVSTYSGAGTRLIQLYGALGNVSYIKCWNGSIVSVLSSAGLTGLKTLYLDFNPVTDISGLINTSELINLSFYNGNITNVKQFGSFHKLQYLDLTNNEITDISPLTNYASISSLQLTNNNVEYPVTGLTWHVVTGGAFHFANTVSTAGEVDAWITDLSGIAGASWKNTAVNLGGTNPARTSASDDDVVWFVNPAQGNNTLVINE